jgi:FkbM family methyltransferase
MRLADRIRKAAPAGIKARLAHLLASPALGAAVRRFFPAGVPHYGCRIPLRGPEDDIAAAKLFFRLYERAEIFTIRRYLPANFDVVELGGSLGVATCQIARRLAPGRRVISVEADPALAAQIERTVKRNAFTNVAVVAKAIHYGALTARFGGESSLGGRIGGGDKHVETITLSILLSARGVGEYVLVADIEGAEVPILLNDAAALALCRMILIEIDGGQVGEKFYSVNEVADMIAALGFVTRYRYGPVVVFERR